MKHLKLFLILAFAIPAAAQQRISERTTLAGASIDTAADWFPIVDTSAGTSGDKKTSLLEMWKALGGTNVSSTELGYLDGVTSAIQTQLDAKAASSHTHSLSNLTQSGATSGQVPTWNGSAWAAATPSGATVDNASVNTAIATSPLATRAAVMDADDAFNFILVGDSIMAGTTSGGATSDHYLSATLGSKSYFSGRATIINKGVSGRTTTQIVSDWTTGANTDAYAYRPSNNGGKRAVILVCAGINDWNTSASMTTALSNMTTYVTNAKAAGFEVWLGIPLPASYGGINDYATRTGMKAYIRGLRSLTTPDKKIDFSQLVHNMTGTGTGSIWTGDSLHPNNALYDTMADLINLRAWGDDRLAVSVDLGTMAFQDSDAGRFDGVADFYSTPNRYAATGTTAEYGAKVAGAGSNKQVKFGHTSVINGNVPANGFVLSIWNGSAWETMGFGQAGDLNVPRTVTASGTTSTQTINKPSGSVNAAAGATSVTINNSLVTANTHCMAVCATNDSTAYVKNVVCGSGTITVNLGAAATAETAIRFFIVNSAN